jgi:hypothetical protein
MRTIFIDVATYPKPINILAQHFANFSTLYPNISSSNGLYSIQDSVNKMWVECVASALVQGVQTHNIGAAIQMGQRSGNTFSLNDGNHRFFATVLMGIPVPVNYPDYSYGNRPIQDMIWDLNPIF